MKKGQRVGFRIWDNLFAYWIWGEGILTNNIFGKLWRILPDANPMLSGGEVQVHENAIWRATGLW